MAALKYRNIVTYNKIERGGHFAAFEVPALLFDDFVGFVKKVEEEEAKKSKKGNKSEL